MTHSKLGLTSFIISIVCSLLMFLAFGIAGVMEMNTPGGMDEESVRAMIVGLAIIGLILIQGLSFILGTAGLFQKGKKKVFAIIGMLCSAFTVFCTLALIGIGLMMA